MLGQYTTTWPGSRLSVTTGVDAGASVISGALNPGNGASLPLEDAASRGALITTVGDETGTTTDKTRTGDGAAKGATAASRAALAAGATGFVKAPVRICGRTGSGARVPPATGFAGHGKPAPR